MTPPAPTIPAPTIRDGPALTLPRTAGGGAPRRRHRAPARGDGFRRHHGTARGPCGRLPRAPALRGRLRGAGGASPDDDGAHLRPGAGQPAGRGLPAGEHPADRQPRRRGLDGPRFLAAGARRRPAGTVGRHPQGARGDRGAGPRDPPGGQAGRRRTAHAARGTTTSPRTPSPRRGRSCRTAAASS